ncbi:YtxH domain-containing protein [Hymenobacter sp. BT770]|uniref:YtxH domain-containing protein n=1 Tax=Hymenobacter sp. BT770 TaxID=2886942 RepID=UPI001D12A940|nr:YtxH domain-containing protein [Hymenobacter sp. BT770]MCC3155262.1 YtxH domain-containing protein [Hymenobacter sp. BT770]MDO3417273.1 YtxH domain-containing protein [Hymenobacter sp. BT770]
MKDDKGKVILSLLAGATAGIVAGLLLAPETGDDARSNLRRSASKWGGDLGKLVKDTLAKVQGAQPGHTNPDAAVSEDKEAADRLLEGLGGSNISSAHTFDADPDYDGFGDDARHQGPK